MIYNSKTKKEVKILFWFMNNPKKSSKKLQRVKKKFCCIIEKLLMLTSILWKVINNLNSVPFIAKYREFLPTDEHLNLVLGGC